jgi:hypothetical protein
MRFELEASSLIPWSHTTRPLCSEHISFDGHGGALFLPREIAEAMLSAT